MSHELRTPLNGIIGITRILKDEKVLPEQQEHLNTLQDLSEHTLQLINNILDFAKVEAGKATLESRRFGLRRFLDKMTSIFQGTARLKGIRFEVNRLGETDIYVNGDEIRLSQVLINLIGNAFKFTEKGSVILSCNAEIQKNNCAEIRFSIQDTGIGIKQENLSRIFESFSQADANTTRKFGGTGLGLSIGEKILGLMGAKLNVKSEYGKGTEFCFSLLLPVSSKTDAMPLFETNNPGADKDLTGVNILLAEDNKVNQVVACRLLQKMNATVSVVSNGKEATEYNGIHDMSVILMDLDMPVMDGYESTYLIKKKHPGTPVIALTAASFDDMHNYLSRKGFDEVVQKPFVPDDLLSKIQAVMKKSA
jgi:CheY-like chemotaxis protein